MANEQRPASPKLFQAANLLVRPLLQSPLHRLLNSRLLVISYTGRRTARQYTHPIGYFPRGQDELLSNEFQILVRQPARRRQSTAAGPGPLHDATTTMVEDDHDIASLLGEFAARNGPRAANGPMLGLPGDRPPTREELLVAASKTTLLQFQLL